MNAKHLVVALVVMIAAGCADHVKPTTTVNPQADLSSYDTFFLMKGHSSGSAAVDDRLMSAVKGALLDKGWVEAPEGDGQVAIVVNAATESAHTDQSFYQSWGGWRWRLAGSANTNAAAGDYKPGTVVVTIFETATKQAIWRGSAPAVARIFAGFPDRPLTLTHPEPLLLASAPGPEIFFSAVPTLLVLVDGAPVYRPVPGTDLERVVNTKPLIVRDPAGMCYLRILDGWMQAYSLESGWWTVSGVPPSGGPTALRQAIAARRVDLLDRVNWNSPAAPPRLSDDSAPMVIVAQAPAELIVTDGPMVFAPIAGTALMYVVNTSADVFKEPTDQQLYVLIAGRWFRSWKTDGPWQAVAGSDLPADFARIPDGSPKAGVKAAIAGYGR